MTDTAGLLEGRVAVVSGIGPGMGRAIALELARAGADVALAARREESMRPVAAEIEALGRRALCVATDIGDPDACRLLAVATAAELGRIDVLVNNAFAEEDWHDPFDGFDPARWRRPIDVNVFGTLTLSQTCIPHLKKSAADRGSASIVMITTLSVRNPIPLLAGYAASKRALDDRGAGDGQGARAVEDPRQLRRAGAHPRPLTRRVLRLDRRAARDRGGGGRRGDRRR